MRIQCLPAAAVTFSYPIQELQKKSGSALRQTGKEIDGRLVALSVLRHRYKLSFFLSYFFFSLRSVLEP